MDNEAKEVLIGEITRSPFEKLVVKIQPYKDQDYLSVRFYFKPEEEWIPTKKGFNLSIERYKELMDLLTKADIEIRKRLEKGEPRDKLQEAAQL